MKKMLLGILLALASLPCSAQFIGYTSQQSVTSTPFNNVSCTAALATGLVAITNIGQGAHFITAFSSSTQQLNFSLQGSYDGITYFDISDTGTTTVNSGALTGVTGTGYYPVVGVRVSLCAPAAATLTIKYAGISLTPGVNTGTNQQGQIVKNVATLAPAGTSIVPFPIRSPFGSSAGLLSFVYTGAAGPAGSTISIACGANNVFLPVVFGPFPLQTTQSLTQFFPLPPSACAWYIPSYAAGGASTANFNFDYGFSNLSASVDVCQSFDKVSAVVTAGAAATTQIVALTGSLGVHVCGYQVSQAVLAGTVQWVYGTGVNCSTGTTSLTGAMQTIVGQPFTYSGPGMVFKVPIGNALCLTTTGAGATAAGVVSYVAVPW